jgi:hypothetical protein
MNDRFNGIPAPVHVTLSDIANTHQIQAQAFSSGHLEQYFLGLDDNKKIAIVHGIPLTAPQRIDSSMVGELLEHLANYSGGLFAYLLQSEGPAPKFDQKIKFNNLHDGIGQKLRSAFYEIGKINDFLDARPSLAQLIAEEVQAIYHNSFTIIPITGSK